MSLANDISRTLQILQDPARRDDLGPLTKRVTTRLVRPQRSKLKIIILDTSPLAERSWMNVEGLGNGQGIRKWSDMHGRIIQPPVVMNLMTGLNLQNHGIRCRCDIDASTDVRSATMLRFS